MQTGHELIKFHITCKPIEVYAKQQNFDWNTEYAIRSVYVDAYEISAGVG